MSPTLERVRVGEILRLERRQIEIDPLQEYRLVGVYSFGRGIFHRDPVVGNELGDYRFFEIRPGDLVVSNIQAWEGAIGYATEQDAGTIGTHRFLTYVPADGRIDANWARYFFLSESGFDLIQRAAPGSVTRNRTLAIDRFEALKIPLPPIDEQRRIAAMLDAVSLAGEHVSDLVDRADGLTRAVVSATVAVHGPPRRLGELIKRVERPEAVDPERTYSLLGVRWYGEGLFVRERKDGRDVSASRVYRLSAGDFVYNRLFAWKGSFALASVEFDGCHVSNEFPTFAVDASHLHPTYLMAVVRSPRMWDAALERSSGGTPTSRNRLKEDRFLDLEIALPSLEEQRRVVALVETLDQVSSRRRSQRARAQALALAVLNREFASLVA